MLKTAEYTVKNDKTICLKLKDTVIAHGKQESIVSLIRNVFEERFHVPVEIQVEYEEVKDSKLKFNESRLQQEVNAIMERNHALHEERAEQEKEKEEKAEKKEKATIDKPKEKEAKQQKQFAGTGNNSSGGNSQKWRGGGRSGSFSYRKSDDPNMIFGRDFDDAALELSTVVGEMGEITIRGKVISFEAREIRNEKTILIFAVTDFTDTIMVKMFVRNEQLPDLLGDIKKGRLLINTTAS